MSGEPSLAERIRACEIEIANLLPLKGKVDELKDWKAWQLGLAVGVGGLAMLIVNGVIEKLT